VKVHVLTRPDSPGRFMLRIRTHWVYESAAPAMLRAEGAAVDGYGYWIVFVLISTVTVITAGCGSRRRVYLKDVGAEDFEAVGKCWS
jgi:hypothetical protein